MNTSTGFFIMSLYAVIAIAVLLALPYTITMVLAIIGEFALLTVLLVARN